MAVRRIVANLPTETLQPLVAFYRDLFGLDVLMDHGWIVTIGTDSTHSVQLSFATQGGSGTPVPDLSIEVDDLDETLARARQMELPIIYGPVDEPWGVRRFTLKDPAGRLLNILTHI